MSRSAFPLHLQFQRFECKYLLDPRQAEAVKRFVEPYVEPDPYAARSADRTYRICSLYLDSSGLLLRNETLEGIHERFKLRIRGYSDEPGVPLFLEIKRRTNQVVRKARCRISRADLPRLLAGQPIDTTAIPRAEQPACREFLTLLAHTGARPVVQVAYAREAYLGRFDREARVTFDRQIAAKATDVERIELAAPGFDLVEGRRVVLELKFNGRCPAWMADAIHRFSLQRISYSKYANAVRATLRTGALVAMRG